MAIARSVVLGLALSGLALSGLTGSVAFADMQGTGLSGGWQKRTAVTPDPSKVVVPEGYEVGIFAAGLDTPTSATVDADGNLWVAISGPLFGGLDEIDPPTSRSSTRPASCSRRSARAPSRPS